ncbi:helix-turn-helix domain-containing protein [Polymorphobacter fuscus]|uniref:Helix-turn-helix domain-containing protein n=2 Tax=Sandarakinorhabdus fusca TaxID=1439888 RepID=A0A7C9GN60_9SPHN|nr:AraC family transcriptional regulator [Polymorphobacter fuscus]KAB7649071.1 helix-turn-helix transcriptional regulator [Polymorphobacter fuscus]MQT16093.1 helix-turn-helix domain-containing protein [Polymorphobacter fuscus]
MTFAQSIFVAETALAHRPAALLLAEVEGLIAGARGCLEDDPDRARRYLAQLSVLLMEGGSPTWAPHPAAAGEAGAKGSARTSIKGGLAGWQLRRVTEHIDRNLTGALAADELAGVARLSTGHFCRAFKATVGETPHSYIIRQRVRRAQAMMVDTRESLSQIALACGLNDQAHLTRLFRRVLGTTPMRWRRTWQADH